MRATTGRATIEQEAAGKDRVADSEYIRLRNVSQTFGHSSDKGGQQALHEINLTIPRGQFVAIVGASGCGKTTILNILAGLVEPTSGSVTLDGERPQLPNPSLSYMFARDALFPWRTAQRNVELPLEAAKWSARDRHHRAREMIELVGLHGKNQRFPLELSQGMRQRVALARTLAPDPELLLMDEPFAALDARTKLTVQTEFLQIWEQNSIDHSDHGTRKRKTVIFVTHDINEAVLMADRVVVMMPSPGRIAVDRMIAIPRPRASHLGRLMYTDEFKSAAEELFESLEGSFNPQTATTSGV